jgi:hypothetical protein
MGSLLCIALSSFCSPTQFLGNLESLTRNSASQCLQKKLQLVWCAFTHKHYPCSALLLAVSLASSIIFILYCIRVILEFNWSFGQELVVLHTKISMFGKLNTHLGMLK